MCENEYASARRCEFSPLQMFPSQKPNRASGPSGERPIHNSMPPVRASTAMNASITFRVWVVGSNLMGGKMDASSQQPAERFQLFQAFGVRLGIADFQVLERFEDDAGNDQARVQFVIGGHDKPRRVLRAGGGQARFV